MFGLSNLQGGTQLLHTKAWVYSMGKGNDTDTRARTIHEREWMRLRVKKERTGDGGTSTIPKVKLRSHFKTDNDSGQ